MKYNLIVAEPGKDPVPYELKGDRIGLGRGPENQIYVPSEFISHTHIEFHRGDDGISIEDLGSKNGTRVNGKPFDGRLELHDGDRILIGECVAAHILLLPDDAEPAEAATKGDAADHKAAATYTTLDKKLQDLETDIEHKQSEADDLVEKIEALQEQLDNRKEEFEQLEGSVTKLRDDLESKREQAAENASPEVVEEIAAIEKNILKQTQKITVLKSDLDKREAEISELQSTAKVKVAEPASSPAEAPAPASPPATAPPAAVPVAPPIAKQVPPAPPSTPAAPAAVPPVKPVAPPTVSAATPPAPEGAAKPPAPPAAPTPKMNTPAAGGPKKPIPIPKKP